MISPLCKETSMALNWQADYERLAEKLTDQGLDVEAIKARLKKQEIETPSWGYSDSGTRFGSFKQVGAARYHRRKIV